MDVYTTGRGLNRHVHVHMSNRIVIAFGRLWLRPRWEHRTGGYRGKAWRLISVDGFGFTFCYDTLPAMTVGQRGVW